MRPDWDYTPERVLAKHNWAGEDYKREFAGLTPKERVQKLVDRRRIRILVLGLKQRFEKELAGLPYKLRRPKQRVIHTIQGTRDPAQSAWEMDPQAMQWASVRLSTILDEYGLHHLWYTDHTLQVYEGKPGAAPPDSQRPVWMRGLDLELDPSLLPDETIAALLPGGMLDQLIDDYSDGDARRSIERHTLVKPVRQVLEVR